MREPLDIDARVAHLAAIRGKTEADMAQIWIGRTFMDFRVERFHAHISDHANLAAGLFGRGETCLPAPAGVFASVLRRKLIGIEINMSLCG